MAAKKRPPVSIRFPESEEILIREAAKKKGISLSEFVKTHFWESFNEGKPAA